MPRLGGVDDVRVPRRIKQRKVPRLRIRNVLAALIGLFVLRNLLRKDYREEGLKYLKQTKMSDEEIQQYIPRTPEEQRIQTENKDSDIVQMKKQIAFLLEEVQELKEKLDPQQDARAEVLKEMDNLHVQKRKKKEALEDSEFQNAKHIRGMR